MYTKKKKYINQNMVIMDRLARHADLCPVSCAVYWLPGVVVSCPHWSAAFNQDLHHSDVAITGRYVQLTHRDKHK